jgi:NitT/TauT family transport system permease protein
MSAISNGSKETITPPVYQPVPSAIAARRRRSILVNSLRILFLVVIIGGWQLATSIGIVDKFFWGQPSGIWAQIVKWVTQGILFRLRVRSIWRSRGPDTAGTD